jgi:hypothetical protein
LQLRHTSDSSKFLQYFGISAEASFGLGAWSLDGAVNYYRSRSISRFAEYLVVRSRVLRPVKALTNLYLTPLATALISIPDEQLRTESFFRTCGDGFVEGIQTGADFAAVVEFTAVSSEEQSKLSGKLNAVVTGYGSGHLEVFNDLQQLATSSDTHIEYLRHGPNEEPPEPSVANLQGIISYAKDYGTHMTGHEYPIMAVTNDYDVTQVENQPDMRPPSRNVTRVTNFTAAAAKRLAAVIDDLADFDFAEHHRDQFGSPNEALRKADKKQLEAYQQNLEDLVQTCVEDGTAVKCDVRDLKDEPTVAVPRRPNWVDIDVKQFAGTDVGTVPPNEQRILEVRGQWRALGAGPYSDASGTVRVTLVDTAGDEFVTQRLYLAPILLDSHPLGYTVKVRVVENPDVRESFGDNESNGLKGAVY